MHKQEVVVCYMKLNINQFTFNRIVIRILKQFIYESRFFRTKLLTKRIQKICCRTKVFGFIIMSIIEQSIYKPFRIDFCG